VHDSANIMFACRVWGLRSTDLNQGIVYGQSTEETDLDPVLATRFDYDAVFGTVLNRMAIQAVLGEPLTVYGQGTQVRGILNIVDTVECIRISCETPADRGEFRVFNQFTESMSVRGIADTVSQAYPGKTRIVMLDNPRVELENHYYRAAHTGLLELGLVPHLLSETLLSSMFGIIDRHRDQVNLDAMLPNVRWRETASRVGAANADRNGGGGVGITEKSSGPAGRRG
jgi:UDP-sulfoquinovose synthase